MSKEKFRVGQEVLVKCAVFNSEPNNEGQLCVIEQSVYEPIWVRLENIVVPKFTGIKVFDNINKPSHYQGKNGMEAIEVVRNFIGHLSGTSAFYWGNAMKYLLRFQGKNGLEDLKKARKNLDWLIEEMEKEK